MTPTEPIGSPGAAPSGPGWLALIAALGQTASLFAIAGVIWNATRDRSVQMRSEFHLGRNGDDLRKQMRKYFEPMGCWADKSYCLLEECERIYAAQTVSNFHLAFNADTMEK